MIQDDGAHIKPLRRAWGGEETILFCETGRGSVRTSAYDRMASMHEVERENHLERSNEGERGGRLPRHARETEGEEMVTKVTERGREEGK